MSSNAFFIEHGPKWACVDGGGPAYPAPESGTLIVAQFHDIPCDADESVAAAFGSDDLQTCLPVQVWISKFQHSEEAGSH